MIAAVIWDYDGTLVDTRRKNLNVTRAIVTEMGGGHPPAFPALESFESYCHAIVRYANWRDFYKSEFGFSDSETDDAGRKWTDFQMRDTTPAPVVNGLHEVLHRVRDLAQGIVSQGSRSAIERALEINGLLPYFSSIVGFEEVELRRQKPEPDGLLRCIDEVADSRRGVVLYIGDHETDAVCASRANQALHEHGSAMCVRTIAACYASPIANSCWVTKPDFLAWNIRDIPAIVDAFRNGGRSCQHIQP